MSHEASARSPEAPSASPEEDKSDVYDANIRNFAPVARIMKNALPENAKIAKEAKECMQECVSEFISFITSEGKSLFSLWHPVRSCNNNPSFGEMPPGEAKNCQRGRHTLRDDVAGLRKLLRSPQDLSGKVSRSKDQQCLTAYRPCKPANLSSSSHSPTEATTLAGDLVAQRTTAVQVVAALQTPDRASSPVATCLAVRKELLTPATTCTAARPATTAQGRASIDPKPPAECCCRSRQR
jgi:hypothetical protein